MAALAYLVPPVTGLVAFIAGSSARTRLHGLQAIALGAAWPAALYAATLVSPVAVRAVAAVGAALWLLLITGTALGRDPLLPGARAVRAALTPPR